MIDETTRLKRRQQRLTTMGAAASPEIGDDTSLHTLLLHIVALLAQGEKTFEVWQQHLATDATRLDYESTPWWFANLADLCFQAAQQAKGTTLKLSAFDWFTNTDDGNLASQTLRLLNEVIKQTDAIEAFDMSCTTALAEGWWTDQFAQLCTSCSTDLKHLAACIESAEQLALVRPGDVMTPSEFCRFSLMDKSALSKQRDAIGPLTIERAREIYKQNDGRKKQKGETDARIQTALDRNDPSRRTG